MKKIVLLLGAACASALAQTTIVTQAVVGPDGQPTDGTAFIAISAACQSGTSYVGNRTIVVRFKDGAFSVGLVPNDSCITSGGSTSTSYTVSWTLTGGRQWVETWVVPTSSTPVTVASVKTVGVVPVPPSQIVVSQINAIGTSTGLQICTNGTAAYWGKCFGISATATWAQIEAGTAESGSITSTTTWAQIEN
jgi:hypothetical protein